MRPMINKMAFGGSWWDDAVDTAKKIGDSASDQFGENVNDTVANLAQSATQGATSSLESTLANVAEGAAAAHGSALGESLGESASGTLGQSEKTLRYVGYGALALTGGVLLYLFMRKRG